MAFNSVRCSTLRISVNLYKLNFGEYLQWLERVDHQGPALLETESFNNNDDNNNNINNHHHQQRQQTQQNEHQSALFNRQIRIPLSTRQPEEVHSELIALERFSEHENATKAGFSRCRRCPRNLMKLMEM